MSSASEQEAHRHFCLECGEEFSLADLSHKGHGVQFCATCAPPMDPARVTSSEARYADFFYGHFQNFFAAIQHGERLGETWLTDGRERLAPTNPKLESSPKVVSMGAFSVKMDQGGRQAVYPLVYSPSTLIERCGPGILWHPLVWNAVVNVAMLARQVRHSGSEWARNEIGAIAKALLDEPIPRPRLGSEYDRQLLAMFEQLLADGVDEDAAYVKLANRSGLSLAATKQRVSRARDRTGKRRRGYQERKGPAKDRRR